MTQFNLYDPSTVPLLEGDPLYLMAKRHFSISDRLYLMYHSGLINLASLGLTREAMRPGWNYATGRYYAKGQRVQDLLLRTQFEEKIILAIAWSRLLGTSLCVFVDEFGLPTSEPAYDFVVVHEYDGKSGFRVMEVDEVGQPTKLELVITPLTSTGISGESSTYLLDIESTVAFRGHYQPFSWFGRSELDSIFWLALLEDAVLRYSLKRSALLAGGIITFKGSISPEERAVIDSAFDAGLTSFDRLYLAGDMEVNWLTPSLSTNSEMLGIMDIIVRQAARSLQIPQKILEGEPSGILASAKADLVRWVGTLERIQSEHKFEIESVLSRLIGRRISIEWNPIFESDEVSDESVEDVEESTEVIDDEKK